MPVRKIPKNHLMVTGGYSSSKNTEIDAFESLLEKDYLLLLDFDESVRSFEVQPVHIPVPGVPRGYVPDVWCVTTRIPRLVWNLNPPWLKSRTPAISSGTQTSTLRSSSARLDSLRSTAGNSRSLIRTRSERRDWLT